ncbi:hypothetical protein [Desulfosarcina sp.]|uniref:hypothetical protein n=1 Tax=Desulfosarcina sp. TaxID=2027861 RepID=UPI0029A0F62C|nr:hypothetical protein [Desulfosarcina sp.]MDX2452026.1 hypothetical protein [Desulfosarcina sp.]MDX2489810.1 hypothetical protein [Desulfosarcina sp.]
MEAIHTPGYAPGSVVYSVESDGRRVLFGQDVHGPLHDDFASDARACRQSLVFEVSTWPLALFVKVIATVADISC